MMVEKKRGLETLEVWQKAIEYAVEICQNVIPLFPSEEKWALSSQLRRAAQSIPANIAEGYGRFNYQEAIHFCYIARGSMAETKTHLVLAHRLGYMDDTTYQDFQIRLSELGKMINGYINHLRKQKEMSYLHETAKPTETYEL
jgi:four helix bundle protein